MVKNIYELIKANSDKNPNKIAVITDRKYTYEDLITLVDSYFFNFPKFSNVAILLDDDIDFIVLMLLASKNKFTIIPFCSMTKDIDKEKFDIDFVVTSKKIDTINPYVTRVNNHYIVVTTSGSTSEPKPIVLTEEIKLERINITKTTYNLNETDKILISTPLYHSLAQRGVLMGLVLNATIVILKNFSVKRYLTTIQDSKITFSFSVSSQLEAVSDMIEYYDLSSLKSMISTSYSLKLEVKQNILKHFDIYECYGTSEVGCVTHLTPDDIKKYPNSIGKPLENVEIKIENGEIIVKSPWKAKEYYKINTINTWFNTGDLGEIIDGYLYYKGRAKELIKTGGISVYPMDIEKVLLEMDKVKEVAVIGIDDSYLGEAIIAIIVGDIKKSELLKYAQKRLIPYQMPLFYDIVDSLPKNNMGKLQKFKLKNRYNYLNLGEKLKGLK